MNGLTQTIEHFLEGTLIGFLFSYDILKCFVTFPNNYFNAWLVYMHVLKSVTWGFTSHGCYSSVMCGLDVAGTRKPNERNFYPQDNLQNVKSLQPNIKAEQF